jgi:hypothetical protein
VRTKGSSQGSCNVNVIHEADSHYDPVPVAACNVCYDEKLCAYERIEPR